MIEINGRKIEPVRVIDPEITFTDDCKFTEEEKKQFKKEYHNRLWYYGVYLALIKHCQEMEKEGYPEGIYTEKHHILPKCMGGKNDKSNLVRMPAREHIMAHILLFFSFPFIVGLAYAFTCMTSCSRNNKRTKETKRFSTKLLAKIKEISSTLKSENMKGEKNSMFGKHPSEETRKKMSESRKGRIVSEETRKKISKIHKGKVVSQETKEKLRQANLGKHFSEETKRKISLANLGKVGVKGWHHTEETKLKMSEQRKGELNPNWGKHFETSDEVRKQRSERMKGKNNIMFGKHHTEETKRKISESKLGKKQIHKHILTKEEREEKSIKVSGKNNPMAKQIQLPDGTIYSGCMKDLAKELKIDISTLRNWIKNKPEKGYKYYKED